MRKHAFIAAAVLVAVLVPVGVWAASDRVGSDLEHQTGKWTTNNAATSSTQWRNVPRLRAIAICSDNAVSATLGVRVSGAPVLFRVVIDTPEAPMRPAPARFVPDGTESFSFTFVRPTIAFEADDTHSFSVQWRSPSGQQVTMTSGVLNLLYERGNQGCP